MSFRKTLSRIEKQSTRAWQKMCGKQFVHFLHIGKTGGSAVKEAMRPYAADRGYVIYLHSHAVTLRDVPEGERVFFFLRDPISRFISGFYSRQRQGRPTYFYPWSPEEEKAFEAFSAPDQLAAALSSTDDEEKKNARSAMKSIEHVRDSYWKWFENADYFTSRSSDIFFIGFQERLTQDFEILKRKLGLPDRAELPRDDIVAHRNPGNRDNALDETCVANLKAWYREDYRFLDLCREVIEENRSIREGHRAPPPS